MSSYYQKLKDARWLRRREEILARDNYQCQWCGNSDDDVCLQVHHRYYLRSDSVRDPWDYSSDMLITLCRTCHDNAQDIIDKLHELVFLKINSMADQSLFVEGILPSAVEHFNLRHSYQVQPNVKEIICGLIDEVSDEERAKV
jgi:hypothetical protein